MFSKELENLIQASLEDGVLEEYEKAALVKRAQNEGVDITELEIYINSLLQRRSRELENEKKAKREQAEKEKREAFGRKCPNCGAQVPPLTLVCDCGYEFTKGSHVSSIQLFFEKINNIQLSEAEIDSCSDVVKEKRGSSYYPVKDANGNIVKKVDEDKVRELKEKKKTDIISSFPVPNTKEDIVEFLSLAAPNARQKGGFFGTVPKRLIVLGILAVIIIFVFYLLNPPGQGELGGALPLGGGLLVIEGVIAGAFLIDKDTLRWNKSATVWRAKFDQVLMKGRSLRGDPEFQKQLDYYENSIK